MLQGFIQAALEAEMDAHLDSEQRGNGNKRNGKGHKTRWIQTIKISASSFSIEPLQDRQSSFDPQLIKKRETVLADSLQDKIIGLYGRGGG